MTRALLLVAAPGLDEDARVRAWIRARYLAEVAALAPGGKVVACAPLAFLRLATGSSGPLFAYLHPSGAVLVDGRETGGRWEGDAVDALRAYRAFEPTARALVFARLHGAAPPDTSGLDAEVLLYPEVC